MEPSSASPHYGPQRNVARYVVQSSDVLQDMRINVSEEGSETVTWYKERFLSDDEIIDHVVHNPTSTICWTIHRPSRRGWYIRIRSPTFAPGAFIPFIPLPRTSPHYVDAALSFNSRTNRILPPQAQSPAEERPSLSSVHSYPPSPTPPPVPAQPPSPSAVRAKLEEVDIDHGNGSRPSSQITQFVLAPHAPAEAPHSTVSASLFSRALNALRSSKPSNSSSFTLSRIPTVAPPCSPPPYASVTSVLETATFSSTLASVALPPILTFHDHTPLLTVRSLTGVVEIDETEEKVLGIDTGFWIAVALTYLDFLEERESYLAAMSD